jgi:hypothetical protein
MAQKWTAAGGYFEACNCETACPCVFLSPPTTGKCTALIAWHIDAGHFGTVALDGLNIALALDSPGPLTQVKWNVALYLDARATEEQRDALTQIFSGQAGGHPAVLASFIGQVLGIKSAAIDYQAMGKKRSIKIAGVGEAEIEALQPPDAADTIISNHPLAVAPGHPAVVARSKKLSYRDFGLAWELSSKNGFYSPFTYQGA